MSVVRKDYTRTITEQMEVFVCDACGSEGAGDSYYPVIPGGWIGFAEQSYRTSERYPSPKEIGHVCSWQCLATYVQGKAIPTAAGTVAS
jgi:hypothetical protein